jgi:hypothetical protein
MEVADLGQEGIGHQGVFCDDAVLNGCLHGWMIDGMDGLVPVPVEVPAFLQEV